MSKIFHPLLALIASATDKQLAKFIIFGKCHLDDLVSEFVEYYNPRSSMVRDHLRPIRETSDDV